MFSADKCQYLRRNMAGHRQIAPQQNQENALKTQTSRQSTTATDARFTLTLVKCAMQSLNAMRIYRMAQQLT